MITFLKKSVKFREKNGKILFQSKISRSTILVIISRPTPLLLSNVVVYGFYSRSTLIWGESFDYSFEKPDVSFGQDSKFSRIQPL